MDFAILLRDMITMPCLSESYKWFSKTGKKENNINICKDNLPKITKAGESQISAYSNAFKQVPTI